jgi:hypothetical protein
MKKIKIATLWVGNFRESLIFKLIEDITNKRIEIVSIENSEFYNISDNLITPSSLHLFKASTVALLGSISKTFLNFFKNSLSN